MASLTLQAGGLRLDLRPDLGGCIAGLWLDEVPVMMSTDARTLTTSRPSGCFPLVPYSNRLGFRRFRWEGREHHTLPNSGASPHSMHGVAWQRPWEVTSLSESGDAAELRQIHVADEAWPFDFVVQQSFRLMPQSLRLRMRFTNTDEQDQPVGLGWHPYFPRRKQSRLQAAVTHRWESDADGLPTHRVAQPGGIDDAVSDLRFDHCFEGWGGAAAWRDESLALSLTSSLPYLVVYTPPGQAFFCVEPVSHVNNAIQMPDPVAHGLCRLAPGAQFDAWMNLVVERA